MCWEAWKRVKIAVSGQNWSFSKVLGAYLNKDLFDFDGIFFKRKILLRTFHIFKFWKHVCFLEALKRAKTVFFSGKWVNLMVLMGYSSIRTRPILMKSLVNERSDRNHTVHLMFCKHLCLEGLETSKKGRFSKN